MSFIFKVDLSIIYNQIKLINSNILCHLEIFQNIELKGVSQKKADKKEIRMKNNIKILSFLDSIIFNFVNNKKITKNKEVIILKKITLVNSKLPLTIKLLLNHKKYNP